MPLREAVLDAGSYIRGFVSQMRQFGGVELVGLLSPRDAVGGSSGSWITKEAFDKYTGGIVKDLEEQGPFDGVFLALHGAMAVTGVPRPEVEIARRVRATVGDIPIVATFDLHGNEDEAFLDNLNRKVLPQQALAKQEAHDGAHEVATTLFDDVL